MRGRDVRELKRRTHDVIPPAITKRGVIKMYRVDKGYGFILGGDGSEIFFHHSVLTGRMPMPNDAVLYTSGMRHGRLAATSVRVLE
jgi:cold shock CspA family protein